MLLLQLHIKCRKAFFLLDTGFTSEERGLMGNRKWSIVITVSHQEGQHDAIKLTHILHVLLPQTLKK